MLKPDNQSTDTAAVTSEANQALPRMGELFLYTNRLNEQQIEQILFLQQTENIRFGEAAIRLGFLTKLEVEEVLAEQFGFASGNLLSGHAHPSLAILHRPFTPDADQIRALASTLILRASDKALKIAIVSANRNEGKSYLAASLGVALAHAGKRTLLIDADLRTPSLQRYFALGNRPAGLSSVLIRRSTAVEAVLQVLPDLHVLPAGPTPPNPLEIMRAPRLRMILDEFHDRFDAFVVDTCATGISSDAQMVAHQVENVIVVGRKDQTTLSQLNTVLSDMRIAGANILGTVFNAFDDRQTDPLVRASRSVFGRLHHLLERFKRKRYTANQFDRDL